MYAEQVAGLRLDDRPGRHAAEVGVVVGAELSVAAQIAIGDEATRCVRLPVSAGRILAQEYLMRRARRIGLVLIDKWRGGILLLVNVVGRAEDTVGPWQHGRASFDHEIGAVIPGIRYAVRSGIEQRIVGLQRNKNEAITALSDKVEAVIEELAEEGEPGIERRRQAKIG